MRKQGTRDDSVAAQNSGQQPDGPRDQEGAEVRAGERIYCFECQSCGQVVQSPYEEAKAWVNCCDDRDMVEIPGPHARRVPPERGKSTILVLNKSPRQVMLALFRGLWPEFERLYRERQGRPEEDDEPGAT